MKRTIVLFFSSIFLAACNNSETNSTGGYVSQTSLKKLKTVQFLNGSGTGHYSQFISVDSANKMISSYLNSINYQHNDTELRSIIINADSLRSMLSATTSEGGKIVNVKLMFAHTLNYINSGGKDQNAGYQSGALTLIIAGYDSSGKYLYIPYKNMVLDYSMPCPTNCGITTDLLPQ
jgi:hypothetical protein